MTWREGIALAQALAWPVLVLVLVIVFWKPLHGFAARLTHVRVAGQEFVARTIEQSQLLLRSIPLTSTQPEFVPREIETEVMQLAARKPQAALVRLGREIDKAIRRLAVVGNWLEPMEQQPNQLWRRLILLSQNTGWDADRLAFVVLFSILYEGAVDGDTSLSNEDMMRLVSQGLTLLGLVNSEPRGTNVVLASNLPIFEDIGLTNPIANKFAVLLNLIQSDGREATAAFFTSRPDYYKRNMRVGYEWRENPPKEELHGFAANPEAEVSGSAITVSGWDFQGRNMADFD